MEEVRRGPGRPRKIRVPGDSAPIVAQTPDELSEQDALEQAIADNALTPPKPEAIAAVPGDLPDADSIDPKTIKKPTLSRQGWVLPA